MDARSRTISLSLGGPPSGEPLDHPVLDVVRARARSGSVPGAREDPHSVALVIEGGGMRGVVPAGMAVALEQLGLRDAFDHVYGASAGALVGAAFLAGQARLAASLLCEDLPVRAFVDPRRALRRRPVLSLPYLLDHVAELVKPVDWDGVLGSPIPLHPVASSLGRWAAVDLSGSRTKDELKSALRASATIPLVAGPPVARDDDRLLDASVFEPIPFKTALAQGRTHLLVLLSRPEGVRRPAPSLLERTLGRRALERVHRGLGGMLDTRGPAYDADVSWLVARTSEPGAAPWACALRPPAGVPVVGTLERDRERLAAGVEAGARVIFAAVGGAAQPASSGRSGEKR